MEKIQWIEKFGICHIQRDTTVIHVIPDIFFLEGFKNRIYQTTNIYWCVLDHISFTGPKLLPVNVLKSKKVQRRITVENFYKNYEGAMTIRFFVIYM